MAIHAWDPEVSMDNLINNTVTAINNGEHPEAPGVPGWTVIIPWVTVDSIAQNHSAMDEDKFGKSEAEPDPHNDSERGWICAPYLSC